MLSNLNDQQCVLLGLAVVAVIVVMVAMGKRNHENLVKNENQKLTKVDLNMIAASNAAGSWSSPEGYAARRLNLETMIPSGPRVVGSNELLARAITGA